jgi:hypothetical protein
MRERPTASGERADATPLAAILCWTVGLMLAAASWRLSPAELAHAWPWSAALVTPGGASSPWPLLPAAGGLVAIGLGLSLVAWRRRRDPAWRRSLLILCGWPALPLVTGWLTAPAAGPPGLPLAAWLLGSALTARVLLATGGVHGPASNGRVPAYHGRLWVGGHLAAIILLIALARGGGGGIDRQAFLTSLLAYPAYALLQMILLLAVAWPHLHRLADRRQQPAIATMAALFALVHWPNPLLMLLCGVGMAAWAREYGRGRGLLQLAVSMGLLATLVAQGLPDTWTDHMRVGPRYVRQRAVPVLAAEAARIAAAEPATSEQVATFVAALYPDIVGRAASLDELEGWSLSVAACQRGSVAWLFYLSDEYRRRFGEPAGEALLPGNVHWTRLPVPWPERIGAHTGLGSAPAADDWTDHLRRLYREVLGREPQPAELASWSPALSLQQERRLVEVVFEQRRALAATAFQTLGCEQMRLPH